MKIIEFFTADDKEFWLKKISECEWGAGQFLADMLRNNTLQSNVGENVLVPMLTDGDRLVSFCTLAPLDDIQPTDHTPWVGFVYTFPQYRGHRYAGLLLDYAECIATIMGKEYVYISTNHVGLYEKYGYEFFETAKDIGGEDSRVYRKCLFADGPEKEDRMNRGNEYKAEIVRTAREGVDPIAYCGFSCNHCFLGCWCGGCKSVFSCCSFGTMFDKGVCPNAACCRERNLSGCYECDEVRTCTKGFYADGNDGANACRAQAVFIKKHGREAFFKVHDRLHEEYDFQKTQEILSDNFEKGLQILESYLN